MDGLYALDLSYAEEFPAVITGLTYILRRRWADVRAKELGWITGCGPDELLLPDGQTVSSQASIGNAVLDARIALSKEISLDRSDDAIRTRQAALVSAQAAVEEMTGKTYNWRAPPAHPDRHGTQFREGLEWYADAEVPPPPPPAAAAPPQPEKISERCMKSDPIKAMQAMGLMTISSTPPPGRVYNPSDMFPAPPPGTHVMDPDSDTARMWQDRPADAPPMYMSVRMTAAQRARLAAMMPPGMGPLN